MRPDRGGTPTSLSNDGGSDSSQCQSQLDLVASTYLSDTLLLITSAFHSTDVNQRTPLSHLSNSSSYKRLIPVFRALYTLLRLLPAHRLQRRIRGGRRATGFRIGAIAYQEGHSPRDVEYVRLEQPIEVEGGLVEDELGRWEFDGVEHMYGSVGIYLKQLGFSVRR